MLCVFVCVLCCFCFHGCVRCVIVALVVLNMCLCVVCLCVCACVRVCLVALGVFCVASVFVLLLLCFRVVLELCVWCDV